MDPVCVADYERLAEERLEPGAFGYYAGGAADELALTGNAEAWRALKLRPRVLVDVAEDGVAGLEPLLVVDEVEGVDVDRRHRHGQLGRRRVQRLAVCIE